MSVFTTVHPEALRAWLQDYTVGELVRLEGIASGIENTNYFVSTTQAELVLTLFEKLQAHELPYYLNLMAHLAEHGIPCPAPVANLRNERLGLLHGKPASLVTRLSGRSVENPNLNQCAAVGRTLAATHKAGHSYPGRMANPRGPLWWTQTAPKIMGFLSPSQQSMLQDEISTQSRYRFNHLPNGVIHADLFRDNVLMNGEQVGGLIDFYFACNDVLLYDVAITINDWCVTEDGDLDAAKVRAFLHAYHEVRPFNDEEARCWLIMLRAAALRFWTSRLFDLHCPRPGEMTHAKDPTHFELVLQRHRSRQQGDVWL